MKFKDKFRVCKVCKGWGVTWLKINNAFGPETVCEECSGEGYTMTLKYKQKVKERLDI